MFARRGVDVDRLPVSGGAARVGGPWSGGLCSFAGHAAQGRAGPLPGGSRPGCQALTAVACCLRCSAQHGYCTWAPSPAIRLATAAIVTSSAGV